jgi:DNA-binding transcriptional LysR family regulator
MPNPGTPTIDQLKVFLSVVEAGSFAAAGRRLGRATSAISYTVANLETQLGVTLFDREQTRKPTLTDAGAAVLAKARSVLIGVDDLRTTVKGLLEGLEAEVVLVVDVMLPTARLVDAVQAFEATFPTVKLRFMSRLSAPLGRWFRRVSLTLESAEVGTPLSQGSNRFMWGTSK